MGDDTVTSLTSDLTPDVLNGRTLLDMVRLDQENTVFRMYVGIVAETFK